MSIYYKPYVSIFVFHQSGDKEKVSWNISGFTVGKAINSFGLKGKILVLLDLYLSPKYLT